MSVMSLAEWSLVRKCSDTVVGLDMLAMLAKRLEDDSQLVHAGDIFNFPILRERAYVIPCFYVLRPVLACF